MKTLARLYSAELTGVNARIIEVEADINVGIHSFNIVGLADRSLNEARERVNSALKNSNIKPPNRENRKITINLAPADVRKAGSHYDLSIALAYLVASKQIKEFDGGDKIFLGELALDGALRPINGVLAIAEKAVRDGFRFLFVPEDNAGEAAAIKDITIVPIANFFEAIEVLEGKRPLRPVNIREGIQRTDSFPDFSEIKGQETAKRALVIAAAGNHHLLMSGPPGIGKSFLARALGGIMPDLTTEESIEVTKIWSAAGAAHGGLIQERPFRSPHHTISTAALVGGGNHPKPGEISMAHHGVLFLDEIPEFRRGALEALREPLESGIAVVTRLTHDVFFPAKFTLVAAMNPCPCGYYGDEEKECVCGPYEVMRYQKKISGPLLDRIDLQIRAKKVGVRELRASDSDQNINSALKEKVTRARATQSERFKGLAIKTNGEMKASEIKALARTSLSAEKFLETLDGVGISPRGYHRLIKVARTIADLDGSEQVLAEHLAEAFSYRLRGEAAG